MLKPGQHLGRWVVQEVHGRGCWGLRMRVQHSQNDALHGTAEVGVLDQAEEDWRKSLRALERNTRAGVLPALDHGEHEQLCYIVHTAQDGTWLDGLSEEDVQAARLRLLALLDVIETATRAQLDCDLTPRDIGEASGHLVTSGWAYCRRPEWALKAFAAWSRKAGWPVDDTMSPSDVRHRLFLSRPLVIEDSALALRLRIQVREPLKGDFKLPEEIEEEDLWREEEPSTHDGPVPSDLIMPTVSLNLAGAPSDHDDEEPEEQAQVAAPELPEEAPAEPPAPPQPKPQELFAPAPTSAKPPPSSAPKRMGLGIGIGIGIGVLCGALLVVARLMNLW